MTEKKKKHIGVSVAAVAAASALAVGSTFGSAVEIMDEPPESIMEIMETSAEDYADEDGETEEKKRRVSVSVRARLLALPQAVRAVLLLPLWLLGHALLLAGGAALSLLKTPLLNILLDLLLVFGVGALLFTLLHPDEPLRNLFHRRRLLPMLALWALLCGADCLLPLVDADYAAWLRKAEYAVRIVVPLLLYFAVRGRRQRRTRGSS